MIHDTDERTLDQFEKLMASQTAGQRLQMALHTSDRSRMLVRAGILARRPDASEVEVREQIFLRFYEYDLPQSLIDRTLRDIDKRLAGQPAVPA